MNLANKKQREEWLAKNGIDPAKYNEVEKSFSVADQAASAPSSSPSSYKVDSVPRVFVNGKYFTSAEQAGGDAARLRRRRPAGRRCRARKRAPPPAARPAKKCA